MNDMRLIDADALAENLTMLAKYEDKWRSNVILGVVSTVRNTKTIDAVPVCRCKDCEHYASANGKDSGKPCGYGQCGWPTGIRGIVCADDYCSFGERKEADGNG